jgi:hypothetical protein
MREEWAVYGQNSAPTANTIFNLQNFNLAQPLENAIKKHSYTTETCKVFCADKCVCVVLFLFIVSALAVRFIVPKIVALNHNAEFTSAAG